MFKLTTLPTDIYARYVDFGKSLVKAVGTAERSEDNKEMFVSFATVALKHLGYTVEPIVKKTVKSTAKTPEK